MKNEDRKVVAIIGGGAAGLMASATLVEAGFEGEIILFEKNSYLGAKVMISGGGRCNVTTGIFDVKELLKNYPRGSKFLMSAFYRFPPEKVMEWFEDHDVALKIESDLRVFPKSNNGKDVVAVFEKVLENQNVKILFKSQVVDIQKNSAKSAPDHSGSQFQIKLSNGQSFEVDAVILTTGGNAYTHTGSTGDGYTFAEHLGHHITPLAPSLHSFQVEEPWISSLAGISFDKASLRLVSEDGKTSYTRTGPLLFTHFGVSGPAVFALSSMSAYEHFDKNHPLFLSIHFFPDQKPDVFEKKFTELTNQHGAKNIVNFLDFFLPKSCCAIMAKLAGIAPELKIARLSKEQRKALIKLLFDFPLRVVGRGGGDEFVTAGGVDCSEVNTQTMESKICPGLFFAGEILDIDGFTGGFNLQASWATGRLAGESITS